SQSQTESDAALDIIGVLLLIIGIAAMVLFLQRGVGHSWRSPEVLAEASIALAAFALLGLHARHSGFSVFQPQLCRDINFAFATFYNFMLSALLFVSVVFLPLMSEGPLAFPATLAGALIVPRAVLLAVMMLG